MEWRKIYKSISTNWRFIRLDEFSQLVYLLMIVFADDWGRLTGNVLELRYLLLPANPRPDEDWERAVRRVARSGLIIWDGNVIQIKNWEKYQTIGHRRKASKFPEPTRNIVDNEEGEELFGKGNGKDEGSIKKVRESSGKVGERSGKVEKGRERSEKVQKGQKSLISSPLFFSYSYLFSYRKLNTNSSLKEINKYIVRWARKVLLRWFNRETGRDFEGARSDLEKIEARIREGYSLRAILITIKWFAHQVKIEEIPRKYCRPQTLFRASNFSGYWQNAKEWWLGKIRVKARMRMIRREAFYGQESL